MNITIPQYQHGLSFGGFLVGAFVFVLLSIVGLKLIPAYMEYGTIKNIFATIARDPDMQKASPHDIMKSFDLRTSIDHVTSITADDIDISSDNGVPYLSASYAVKVPLISNISFYIEFNPSSAE